jgi:protein-disulfide isomerase
MSPTHKNDSEIQNVDGTLDTKSQNDYIELRIPKLAALRIPLFLVILLCLVSFGLGYYANQLVTPQPITDLPSTFLSYAKLAGLDTNKFKECFISSKYRAQVDQDIADGTALGVDATPTFYINGLPIVGSLPYSIFKKYIDNELAGLPPPQIDRVATPSAKEQVAPGHIQALGKPAKVTIIEFSDFECPACYQFFSATYPQLKKDYIDTGKVTFIYRHFPLTAIHPNAFPAALASECAQEQGKFWQYHDILFDAQKTWQELPSQPSS